MSNQIELIEKLYAKTKTYKIPTKPRAGIEQLEIEITPLSVEDMGLLNMKDDMPLSELASNTKVMFAKSLGITEEQAAKISVERMMDLLEVVMDINNFKDEDIKKTGIKDFLKKKQDQIKANKEIEDAKSTRTA